MAGISSNALKGTNYPENRKKYNGNELQSGEFGDGSGLELYDFNARTYDQQIGRFLQIDPLIEKNQEDLTPYHFAFDNPVRYGDPDGKFPIVLIPIAIEVGEAIWFGYRAYTTVNSAVHLLSEGVGKNGARPKEKDVSPAAKDETLIPAKSPSKTIDESKPSISDATKDKIDQIETITVPSDKASGKYSHLKEPRKVGPGLETTRAQRKRILEENKKQNGGQLTDDEDGTPLNQPDKYEKGKPADKNSAEVDHIVPRSHGGSNSNSNLRVISKEKNLKKGAKI